MKRWFANYMMRWAFRIFHRYHEQLPAEVNEIIWGEITRKHGRDHYTANDYSGFDPNCPTCVRELEEDRQSQKTIRRWLRGQTKEIKINV